MAFRGSPESPVNEAVPHISQGQQHGSRTSGGGFDNGAHDIHAHALGAAAAALLGSAAREMRTIHAGPGCFGCG